MVRTYRDLEVWRLGVDLAKEIYRVTSGFPDVERYGLVSQMRRAAISISSNLAEGHARDSTAEFQRFIMISMGSIAELETQVILSEELEFLANKERDRLLKMADLLGKMLRSLHKSLGKKRSERQAPSSQSPAPR